MKDNDKPQRKAKERPWKVKDQGKHLTGKKKPQKEEALQGKEITESKSIVQTASHNLQFSFYSLFPHERFKLIKL